MDMGPFGNSRSASSRGGGAATRREPAPARTGSGEVALEEPAVHRVASNPASHPTASKKQPKKSKNVKWLIIVALVLAALAGGWFVWQKVAADDGIDQGKYQAVFFTNGQVYFGKLSQVNGDYMKLKDIYYLQTKNSTENNADNPQDVSSDKSDVQLIKLGNEVHGPEDEMMISRDQVLFFENLKADGKVAQTIAGSKK